MCCCVGGGTAHDIYLVNISILKGRHHSEVCIQPLHLLQRKSKGHLLLRVINHRGFAVGPVDSLLLSSLHCWKFFFFLVPDTIFLAKIPKITGTDSLPNTSHLEIKLCTSALGEVITVSWIHFLRPVVGDIHW